jgi:hypothetical protein
MDVQLYNYMHRRCPEKMFANMLIKLSLDFET